MMAVAAPRRTAGRPGSKAAVLCKRRARVKQTCTGKHKHCTSRARIITSRILMARFLCFPSGSLLLLLLFFSSSGAASQESSSPTRQLWNQFHRRDRRTTDLFGFLLSAVRALLLSAQLSQFQIQPKQNTGLLCQTFSYMSNLDPPQRR